MDQFKSVLSIILNTLLINSIPGTMKDNNLKLNINKTDKNVYKPELILFIGP